MLTQIILRLRRRISFVVYKWGTEAPEDFALLVVAAFCVHSNLILEKFLHHENSY